MKKKENNSKNKIDKINEKYDSWLTKNHKIGFDLIKRIIRRTETIVKNNEIKLVPGYTIEKWSDITIALISLPSNLEEFFDLRTLEYDDLEFKVLWHKRKIYPKVKNKFLQQLKLACENNADFICINELGFPFSPSTKDFNAENDELKDTIGKIANDYNVYIIAGTFHDDKTLFNTAYIFAPGEGHEINLPIEHQKKCSALSVGEEIRIPYQRYFDYYRCKFGYFSLLICLDSYDPSFIFRIINTHKSSKPDIDFIFIPSHTPSSYNADKASKEISMATGSIVSYVNCLDFSPQSSVYLIKDKIKGTKLSENTYIYEINYDDYKKARDDAYSTYHHDLYDRIMCLKPFFYTFKT